LPRRIIIKIPGEHKREEEKRGKTEDERNHEETPVIELKPVESPEVQETTHKLEVEKISPVEGAREVPEETLLESALKNYEAFKKRIEYIMKKDMAFQGMCLKEDITVETIRQIVSRLNDLRKQAAREADHVKEVLKDARHHYLDQLSSMEAEVYWTRLERLDHDSSVPTEKTDEELRKLEKKIVELKNRVGDIDAKIKEVEDIQRRIYEVSSYKMLAERLYEELRKKYMITRGEGGDTILSADIQRLSEEEDLPNEYAVILLWKRIFSKPSM